MVDRLKNSEKLSNQIFMLVQSIGPRQSKFLLWLVYSFLSPSLSVPLALFFSTVPSYFSLPFSLCVPCKQRFLGRPMFRQRSSAKRCSSVLFLRLSRSASRYSSVLFLRLFFCLSHSASRCFQFCSFVFLVVVPALLDVVLSVSPPFPLSISASSLLLRLYSSFIFFSVFRLN